MDPTANIPKNLISFQPTTSKKEKQATEENSFIRAVPKQQKTQQNLPRQRLKRGKNTENELDPIIRQLDQLNVEMDQVLNFWADELEQKESTSPEESSDSGSAAVLTSPERLEEGAASNPEEENKNLEPSVDIQVGAPGGNFKAGAKPSGERRFADRIPKRTTSSSTPRRAAIPLPPIDPSLRSSLERAQRGESKRNAFANSKAIEAKQRSIRKNLPSGLIIDTQGNLSGKYSFTKFAAPGKGRVVLETVFCEKMSEFLKFDSKKTLPPKQVGGVTVIDPVAADLHRLNYKFITKEGEIKEFSWPTDEQAEQYRIAIGKPMFDLKTCKETLRAAEVATTLQDFVKDDNASEEADAKAALVLSATLAQQTSMLLANAVCSPLSPLKMLSNQATQQIGRVVTIIDHAGNKNAVDVKAFGATTFTISVVDGHFEVSVDFPWFAEARAGREAELPLHENGVIGVHTTAKILVNANEARRGILSVKFLDGIQAAYSGRLKLN